MTVQICGKPVTKTKIEDATYGLAALETLVDEIETYLKHATYGLAQIDTELGALVTGYLAHATHGLAQLDTELGTLATAIGAIPTAPALASSWTAALATALGAYTAAKAAFLDVAISSRLAAAAYTAERGTDNALLAANYKQFTKGLTEQAAFLARAYAALASETYVDLLDISGAGYLTGIWAVFYVEVAQSIDLIIEVDGANVGPFTNHATGANQGNIGYSAGSVAFDTTWHANYKWVVMFTPMYRFDSTLKIRLYNTSGTGKSVGAMGTISYLTE